jgi:hypothetical protein
VNTAPELRVSENTCFGTTTGGGGAPDIGPELGTVNRVCHAATPSYSRRSDTPAHRVFGRPDHLGRTPAGSRRGGGSPSRVSTYAPSASSNGRQNDRTLLPRKPHPRVGPSADYAGPLRELPQPDSAERDRLPFVRPADRPRCGSHQW